MNVFLGLDLGTTHIKALGLTEDGQVIAQHTADTPIDHDAWGTVHEADQLVARCQDVVQAVARRVGSGQIKGVGVASFGEEGFFLDKLGHPIYPSIAWWEHRINHSVTQWMESHPTARVETGLTMKPSYTLFKWLWLRETFPSLWEQIHMWVPISEYIVYRLTGQFSMSFSQACRTYVFNPRTRLWIHPWIDEVLPNGIANLPVPSAPGHPVGETGKAAGDFGLPQGIPVVVGGHDHPTGALAVGVVDSGQVLDSMGTAELIYWPVKTLAKPSMDDAFEYGYTGYATGPHYIASGTYTGMMINVLSRTLAVEPRTRTLSQGLRTSRLRVIPNRLGDAPSFDVLGMTSETTPEDIMDAARLASTMAIRWTLEHLPGLSSRTPNLVAIGGGATPDTLQLKADLLQQPIYTPRDPIEGVAMGAAQLARKAVTGRDDRPLRYIQVDPGPKSEILENQFSAFCATWSKR